MQYRWQSTLCKTTENLLETARQKYPNSKIQLEILIRQIGNLKPEQYELKITRDELIIVDVNRKYSHLAD